MTSKSHVKYRPDIDGLRAIAIISVVFNHAGFPGFSGGFVGVDVFFVISGFLITSLLYNEAMATGSVNLSAFYARRIRRLMPAGLVVVAATLLLGALFTPLEEQLPMARSAIYMAIFVSNFFFSKTTGGYFDTPSFSLPLLHTWSLAVEEQYYLVWPLIMLLAFRSAEKPHAHDTMCARMVWMLVVLLLASLVLCVWTTPNHHNFAFYLLPARAWEFAIGGIIGLAGDTFYDRLRREWIEEGLAVVGLGLIIYSVVTFNYSTPFPGWAAILPVLGSAALIIGMTANERGGVRRLLASKPMVFIGLLSYSWYLWHWPLLSIYKIHNLGARDIVANAVLITIALALAWLTYLWVEHPIRLHRPWLFGRIKSTLFVGIGISLLMVLMAVGLMAWRKHLVTSGMSSRSARFDFPLYQKACSLPGTQPVGGLPREECIHGPDKKYPKVLLWGDSHADHMMQMLMEAYSNVSIYQLTMPGCVPVIGYESQSPSTPKYCSEFNRRVLQEILELKKNGLEGVVISARWPIYLWHQSISLADQMPGDIPADAQKKSLARAAMQSNLDRMLTTLERADIRVVVLSPNPELIYSAPQCVELRGKSDCNVPRTISETFVGDSTTALAEVVSRHSNVKLIQLMEFFCDPQTCYAFRNGKVLYFDDDHITATTARDLGRFLKPNLAWLLSKQESATTIKQ